MTYEEKNRAIQQEIESIEKQLIVLRQRRREIREERDLINRERKDNLLNRCASFNVMDIGYGPADSLNSIAIRNLEERLLVLREILKEILKESPIRKFLNFFR